MKPTYASDPIHAQVQSHTVTLIPSVIDQWNKLPVAILNAIFENSIFEFYRVLH